MQIEIDVKNDRSERVAYNMPDLPVYVRKGILSNYPNYSAISHWHDDIELIYVISGQMQYSINGKHVLLQSGEGIFVNTRQLHYGFSKNYQECIFICILMHPLLLCSSPYVEKKFVMPVLQNECFPFLLLHKENTNENNILEYIQEIYDQLSTDTFALKAQDLFFRIWEKLFLLSGHIEQKQAPHVQSLSILKEMIRYIYNHYPEKISLSDISQAGQVGKTTCCGIFQKYTNETPISYLTEYRLKKSIDLLLTTDKTISEICFDVGFSGASYFTETFRKTYHCTPTEYRSQKTFVENE